MKGAQTSGFYLTMTFIASNCLFDASKLVPNGFKLVFNCIDKLGLPLKLLVQLAALIRFDLHLLLGLDMRCLQARLEPVSAAGWQPQFNNMTIGQE